jgi:hypothetical protein
MLLLLLLLPHSHLRPGRAWTRSACPDAATSSSGGSGASCSAAWHGSTIDIRVALGPAGLLRLLATEARFDLVLYWCVALYNILPYF